MEWHSLYTECPRMALGVLVGVGCFLYYFIEAVKRPVLACRRKGAWRNFLETHLTILQERYWPTPWCFESRCQTVLASILRLRLPDIIYRREVLELKDGGQVSLDWLDGSGEPDSPIVLMLPGLTGSSQSEYVKGLVRAVKSARARCCVLNNRGIGGIRLMTTRTYCAANSDDLEEALEHLTRVHQGVPIVALGISLGGMITGNYLTTRGEKAARHLKAAVVMSIPWNMVVGVSSMEQPLCNLLLNRYLVHCLCHLASTLRYQLAGNHKWDLDQVMKSKTIREFDTRFTAMQFGFRDAEDYYVSSCLHDKLHRIKVPLLCLTAADDPFQPLHAIPLEAAEESSHVAIIVTARGGHIGFMEGLLPTTSYYSDRLIGQLLGAVFANLNAMEEVKKEADAYAIAGMEDECVSELLTNSKKEVNGYASGSCSRHGSVWGVKDADGIIRDKFTNHSEVGDDTFVNHCDVKDDTFANNCEVKDDTFANHCEVKDNTFANHCEVKDNTFANHCEVKDDTFANHCEVKDDTFANHCEVKDDTFANHCEVKDDTFANHCEVKDNTFANHCEVKDDTFANHCEVKDDTFANHCEVKDDTFVNHCEMKDETCANHCEVEDDPCANHRTVQDTPAELCEMVDVKELVNSNCGGLHKRAHEVS
ncbi:phospholipase ABHD3 [Procambarus clarkii]|uniref:phospholipase ABHD3 n=1 Tax=Procambarus clarkii TaxID=6728 RepID=UPI003743E487